MEFGGGGRDLISGLPEALSCHILSFLAIKEAASTSLLSRKRRYLFAFVSNPENQKEIPTTITDFEELYENDLSTSFMDFVDRVLALQGNSPLDKFSLKVKDGVDPARINSWIHNVLERRVSDLDLDLDFNTFLEPDYLVSPEIFLSKTLVRLKLSRPDLDVEDVHLPKLKTLHLEPVHFVKHGIGLTKLLSGCHMLEDLVLNDISWFIWDFASVSVTTLKRLTFRWGERDMNPKSVSIDTPNLLYLKFTDTIADEYPKVNFDSLVEAHIDLRLLKEILAHGENYFVGNATDFIMGICNVKILYLSAHTLQVILYYNTPNDEDVIEVSTQLGMLVSKVASSKCIVQVLTVCCKVIPVFNNMIHLTIETNPKVGWESLPNLLENCPNLETLVFDGLHYKATNQCLYESYYFKDANRCWEYLGDSCICKPWEDTPSCISSSPVKMLKVLKFGEIYNYKDDMDKQVEVIKYLLKTMPNLEQVTLYYNSPFNEDVSIVSSGLQMLEEVASPKCKIKVISDNVSFSFNVHSSSSTSGLVFLKNRFPV